MSTARYGRARLEFPSLAAEKGHVEEFVVADLYGGGHGTEAIDLLRDVPILDGHPFRDLHTGQTGGRLDGHTGRIAGSLDATAEEATPSLAAQLRDTVGRKRGEHLANIHAHILIPLIVLHVK